MEKAVLVGIIRKGENQEQVAEHLEELKFLAETAGAEIIATYVQRMDMPNMKTFIGSGKIIEIQAFVEKEKVDLLIFDDELSGSQIKNLDQTIKCKIIDRTNLILDIFARRAQTTQARTQVELAQYQYLLPRLTRMWTHLERQRGGIGLRGPGETEIETDRRIIRSKIALLKKKLEHIDRQNTVQRKSRSQKVRVALVGYTNAGKSTIMNLLSKANVFAEDKLFATLDTTVRNVVINDITFLLSDTVGFIRKLPHRLVESFKSTLDEVREADILLHIVDLSHPDYEQQMKVVHQTLVELKLDQKEILTVFNKIDKLNNDFLGDLELSREEVAVNPAGFAKTCLAKENPNAVFISAKHRLFIDDFRKTLLEKVISTYRKVYPNVPLSVYSHEAVNRDKLE